MTRSDISAPGGRFGRCRLILASGSRIRKELLSRAGVGAFDVVPADVDEAGIRASLMAESDCVKPDIVASVLARAKAEFVSQSNRDALVVGADQVLALGSRIFEKPGSPVEARDHLDRLRGRTHELHSAVVIAEGGEVVWGIVECARLKMRQFSDDFLEQYVEQAGGAVMGSVGAYELEGLGVQLFEKIEGDYFTVLGLPLLPLLSELRAREALAK